MEGLICTIVHFGNYIYWWEFLFGSISTEWAVGIYRQDFWFGEISLLEESRVEYLGTYVERAKRSAKQSLVYGTCHITQK